MEPTSNGLAPQANEPHIFRSPLPKEICTPRSYILGDLHYVSMKWFSFPIMYAVEDTWEQYLEENAGVQVEVAE
jgi:hypothetical protein